MSLTNFPTITFDPKSFELNLIDDNDGAGGSACEMRMSLWLVWAEAMSATDSPGLNEWIDHDQNGALAESKCNLSECLAESKTDGRQW